MKQLDTDSMVRIGLKQAENDGLLTSYFGKFQNNLDNIGLTKNFPG